MVTFWLFCILFMSAVCACNLYVRCRSQVSYFYSIVAGDAWSIAYFSATFWLFFAFLIFAYTSPTTIGMSFIGIVLLFFSCFLQTFFFVVWLFCRCICVYYFGNRPPKQRPAEKYNHCIKMLMVPVATHQTRRIPPHGGQTLKKKKICVYYCLFISQFDWLILLIDLNWILFLWTFHCSFLSSVVYIILFNFAFSLVSYFLNR